MSSAVNKTFDEIAEIYGGIALSLLRNATGNGGEGITGPHEMEKLALAASDRIDADVKARKIKLANLNPYLRITLLHFLDSALKRGLASEEQRKRAQNLLRVMKRQERAEQIEMYGYADDEDD